MDKPKRIRINKYRCKAYQLSALQTLKPPEDLTVSEWAERYRMLDQKTSAEPGPWRNERTPYLAGIMDEFNNYETEEIVFVKPTQVGGTESMNNMIAFAVAQDPAPMEIVYPTQELAESVSSKRLQPMIEACTPLRKKYDQTSKVLELNFNDMFIKIVGSNSPVGVASFAMKYLFIDEIDKFPGATKKEADPVSLAEERTKTFRGRKVYKTSTPTTRTGHIWKAKESADIEKHYFIPCPNCGQYIELKFDHLKWPGKYGDMKGVYGASIPPGLTVESEGGDGEGLSNQDRAEFAYYLCQECNRVITDTQKQLAMKQGRWEIVERRTKYARRVCFWINTLYSPFVRFREIALKFMDAIDDTEKLQNFTNSWLAEPWEDTKLKTSEELVMDRQTGIPPFTVPLWGKILTGGVDVQEDRLYWTIRAYGDYITSQNIAHGQAYSFQELEEIMNMQYTREDGLQMVVNLCLVDSGYNTDTVYEFYLSNADWVRPVKGYSGQMDNHYKVTQIDKQGSKAFGLPLILVDGGKYKDMIASRMRKPNGRGSWMVFQGCDEEYAKQVTAEHKVTVKSSSGRSVMRWVPKTTHADNHYLDCEVYSLAAADILGVRMLHLSQMTEKPPAQQTKQETQTTPEDNWIKANEGWV